MPRPAGECPHESGTGLLLPGPARNTRRVTTSGPATASTRRTVPIAVHLALGLGVVGVAGYGFIAIVGRVFDAPAAAGTLGALTAVYLLINIMGPGGFAAVEQETSRSVSAALAGGLSAWPVARRALQLTAGLFGGIAVLALAAWPLLLRQVLDDRVGLLLAVLLAAAGFGAMYWVRGVLSGQGRLGAYAASLYLEGAARILPCVLLFAFAVRRPDAYGLAFAIGSGVAGLALVPGLRLRAGREGADPAGMGASLGRLVIAGLFMQLIANLAPVLVTFRLSDDIVAANVFALSFVLARVPLFLFSPVQALLVPALTRAVTTGRTDTFRRAVSRALVAVLALGGVGAVLAATVGPWAVELLFNAPQRPSAVTLGVLALATVAMMGTLTLQSALIALGRQHTVTVAWAWGVAVFVPLLFLPIHPIDAALIAQLVGPGTALAFAAAGMWRARRAAASTG